MMAQSQHTKTQAKVDGGDSSEDDMMDVFRPPENDFYNRAARLSCWSKSDADNLFIDGESESDESNDVSIRRLSADDSFDKSQRSHSNSIAGMSRGSFSSSGSKGIRNILGSKFSKRANSIKT